MVDPASVLLREIETRRPDAYARIAEIMSPYPVESLERVLREHLRRLPSPLNDLNVLNERRDLIAPFVLDLARAVRKNCPAGGDAFGIRLTCRLTRNDTQDTLDGRHLKAGLCDDGDAFLEEGAAAEDEWTRALRYEQDLYSSQSQILEVACKRKFSSVYLKDAVVSADRFLSIAGGLGGCSVLGPRGSTTAVRGCSLELSRFVLRLREEGPEACVARVFYHRHHSRDLAYLLSHLPLSAFEAFNDLRQVYEKCGVTCYFFNAARIVRRHFGNDPEYVADLLVALKAQLSTGALLNFNRQGLLKNEGRSPLEVVVFEALKRVCVRMATSPNEGGRPVDGGEGETGFEYDVRGSIDKMFFGLPFNEGTGYDFAVVPE